MAAIFLSYAREDRACAGVLARVLEAAEHEVWWDRHIDSGEEFAAEIEAELDKADVVLVAWSKQSVKSRWVRDEASVGGDTGRLVPGSIDGSQPTIALLPLNTASPDADLRELATQARDSIAHTFSQSGVPLRLLDAVPQNGRPAVDFLISGDVSRNGDKILATMRLDEAAHGAT